MIGKTIGHYEVAEQIGAGGMGEVYRARDTRLGRDVALKIVPPDVAQDHERMSRFEREARLLASLNHPNVAVIHGLEAFDSDSVRVLAMELIPGEDLSARIAKGPVPVDEALEIMRQVAEGLGAAHDKGIYHRDLKPANIIVTPDGMAKVLDFGLAKADPTQSGSGPLDMTQSPTITHDPTAAGVILGTAAYMSPEQARGRAADRRADVWALGVVLFEMLTGERLFAGETVSDTLAAVLRADPDWESLPKKTPPAIKRLLHRCLEKDVRRRLQDIGEARIIIENVQSGKADPVASTDASAGRPNRLVVVLGTLLVFALIAIAQLSVQLYNNRGNTATTPVVRRSEFRLNSAPLYLNARWSPDGERFVYADDDRLWVRDLSRFAPQPILGSEGLYIPDWSPDGKQIVAADGTHLYKLPSTGGQRTRIAIMEQDMHPFASGIVWTDDDRIIFDRGSTGLFSVPASGGDPRDFLTLEEGQEDFHGLDVLPGGRGFIYVIHTEGAFNKIGLFADGKARVVYEEHDDIGFAAWSPSGHIVYARFAESAGVWALPFSLDRLEVTGQPFLVVPDADCVDVSPTGAMLYRVLRGDIPSQLVWTTADGVAVDTILATQRPMNGIFALSPDGRRVAVSETVSDNEDIWIYDIATGNPRRLTFDAEDDHTPAWSPDGRSIAYVRGEAGGDREIFVRAADGRGTARRIDAGDNPAFSQDGKWIVYMRYGRNFRGDIAYAPADGSGDPVVMIDDDLSNSNPQFSPDGRFIAISRGDATPDIHVYSFPDGESSWQVTVDGGDMPAWSANSDRLFYVLDDTIWLVDIETSPTVRIGTPRPLSSGRIAKPLTPYVFPSRDGSRVLLRQAVNLDDAKPLLRIVENWYAEFDG
jgi:serine/threonine protein kinase